MEHLNKTINWLLIYLLTTAFSFNLTACSDDEKSSVDNLITIAEEDLTISVDSETTFHSISVKSRISWNAVIQETDAKTWLTLIAASGVGGTEKLSMELKKNTSKEPRTATIVVTCSAVKKEITVTQAGTELKTMDESEVANLDKYYKPTEFSKMDMFRSDAKWSWFRAKQSEHFFVFWEAGFGEDPNSADVPANLRVNIDDLLVKAEQFYKTNIEVLKMAELGQGKSQLDKYKMEIYLLYQEEWLATGSGYDDVIGALWVNPSTCQPVGSTIAHEIGHSFQYQVYCDKILQGGANDFKQGFRYGYVGSNGGCGFWEQCAQWQSYQDYPEQLFDNYHFTVWLANCHRHFEHEWMRYASYWLQYYWTEKRGIETVSAIWKQSAYPEDAINAYTRLYCGNQWLAVSNELWNYAVRMATFDIDGIRSYSANYQGRYSTKLYSVDGDWYQVGYASCPGSTGFNVIALNIPEAGTTITATFAGLSPGFALAADDPGNYMVSEAIAGQVSTYNSGTAANAGWRYGFVALQKNGTRVYSDMYSDAEAIATFEIPFNTERLYFVVQGMPVNYKPNPWDEKELTDEQYPYKVKFGNTDLSGSFNIDETADPKDLTLTYNLTCNAATTGYELGTIDLQTTGDIQELAQAFVLKAETLSGKTQTILVNTTQEPDEGKIVFGLEQTNGSYSFTYTANVGFFCTAEGNLGSYGNGDPLWVEYDKDSFVITYGHYPGKTEAGKTYTVKPILVYTKNGVQYKAKFVINLQF